MGRTTFLKWVSKRAVHYKQQVLKMDRSHFTKEKVETQRQGESVPMVTQLLRPRNGSPDSVFGACSRHVCSQTLMEKGRKPISSQIAPATQL